MLCERRSQHVATGTRVIFLTEVATDEVGGTVGGRVDDGIVHYNRSASSLTSGTRCTQKRNDRHWEGPTLRQLSALVHAG